VQLGTYDIFYTLSHVFLNFCNRLKLKSYYSGWAIGVTEHKAFETKRGGGVSSHPIGPQWAGWSHSKRSERLCSPPMLPPFSIPSHTYGNAS